MDQINICNMCKENKNDEQYVSYVHKWHLYNGYTKGVYPRYFCSKVCLDFFEKNFRCNHCHIVAYEGVEYKEGDDGFIYCYDEIDITIGPRPCYQILFQEVISKL